MAGHNLGNSQVSVNRTIGPTLVLRCNRKHTYFFWPNSVKICLISSLKPTLWVLIRIASAGRGDSNEPPQHRLLLKNGENYPSFIIKYVLYPFF